MRCLTTILTFLLLTGTTMAQPAPAPDCARLATETERHICRSPLLSGIARDIDEAFKSVIDLWRDAPDAVAALREEQATYEQIRNDLDPTHVSALGQELDRFLEQRRGLLRILGEPREGLAGLWANGFGTINIVETGANTYDVTAETIEWIAARWVCGLSGEAAVQGGAITIDAEDGWTVRVRRRGALLEVQEQGPDGRDRPYCGAGGSVAGLYFPATTP